jgi:hypothetical protein
VKEDELFRAYGSRPKNRGVADPMPPADGSTTDRFLRRIEKADDHWLWRGHKTRSGYGIFIVVTRSNERMAAHRFAWELWHGALGPDVLLENVCGRNDCVRPDPDHWREATRSQITSAMHRAKEVREHGPTPREAEFRARRAHAISTAIPHEPSDVRPVIHRLSTSVHARNGGLSTNGPMRYGYDEILGENDGVKND